MSTDTFDVGIWMPLFISDTLKEAGRLTDTEFSVLLRLRLYYWDNKGPLPDNDNRLAMMVGKTVAEWFGD